MGLTAERGAIVLAIGLLVWMLFSRRSAPAVSRAQPALQLAPFMTELRKELEATAKNAGASPMFRLKSTDIEVTFVVSESQTDSGKVEYEVVTVQDEHRVSSDITHKVTLHLESLPGQHESAAPGVPR